MIGRLISFLSVGLFCSFLAGSFQVPNMVAIMLLLLWIGMGAGLKFGYALAGVVLMPFAFALPMWLLPAPNEYHRIYPGDDSMLFEVFFFKGSSQELIEAQERHAEKVAAAKESPAAERPDPAPTVHEANEAVLKKWSDEGPIRPGFDIWPTPKAWILGLLVTIVTWLVNTVTAAPFREPRPLGAA